MSDTMVTQEGQTKFYFQSTQTRQSLLEGYKEVRRQTEKICAPLEPEDCVVQSMEDTSPTRWHLAHTSWFFDTFVLSAHNPNYQSLYPQYAYLFNSYYVHAGERYPRQKRGLVTRPTVKEVYAFRKYVDEQLVALMESTDQEAMNHLAPLIEIGMNHEQQHQELILTDIKHVLSLNPLYPVYCPQVTQEIIVQEETPNPKVPKMRWISFEEGIHQIGHEEHGFCFDNERPRHRHFLESFRVSDRLVTNREYMEFIDDGGYDNPLLWLSDGWGVREEQHWKAPLYWLRVENKWHYFTLGGLREVEPWEPVCHVSFYEADAFARWAGARLPKEVEWEVAATGHSIEGNFAEQEHYHPVPLGSTTVRGQLSQVFGDVWEWTCSPYVAYPGYRPMHGALGEYNGKFMVNQIVLRGGSCVSSQSHLRPSYRNFFHPSARWQFSGIRLVQDGK